MMLLARSSPAIAQASQDGPTDSDLRAGYCLKVKQDKLAWLRPCESATQAGINAAVRAGYQKTCDNVQRDVERLKDYLSARGYLFGPKDPMPIIIAGDRGESDLRSCMQQAQHIDPASQTCMDRCTPLISTNSDAWSACMNTCPRPETCQRELRCDDLSFLPF